MHLLSTLRALKEKDIQVGWRLGSLIRVVKIRLQKSKLELNVRWGDRVVCTSGRFARKIVCIMWSRIVASVLVLLAMAPAAAHAHGRRDADGNTKPVDPADVDPATVVFNRGSDTDVEPTPVRACTCAILPRATCNLRVDNKVFDERR